MALPEMQDYDHVGQDATARMRELREDLSQYERRGRELVSQRPLLALTIAVVGGYMLGRLLSRGLR